MNKKVIAKAIECLACVGLFAATWRINSISQAEKDLERIKTELKVTEEALGNANSKLDSTQTELNDVNDDLSDVLGELEGVNEELDNVKGDLDLALEELENLRNKVTKDEIYSKFLIAKYDILQGRGDARKNLRISYEGKILDDQVSVDNWISLYTLEDGTALLVEDYSVDEMNSNVLIYHELVGNTNPKHLKSCIYEDEEMDCNFYSNGDISFPLNFSPFHEGIMYEDIFDFGINEKGNYYFYCLNEDKYNDASSEINTYVTIYCELTKDGKFVEYSVMVREQEIPNSGNIFYDTVYEDFKMNFYYGGISIEYINHWLDLIAPYLPK